MDFAVTWIANGFSPESPFEVDELSRRCLAAAVSEHKRKRTTQSPLVTGL